MKIESSEAAKAQFYINASAHRSEKAAAEEPSAAKQQYDRVDISRSVSQETDFSHTLASRLVQEVRAANSTGNIQKLKDQVQNGTYTVDAERLAAAAYCESIGIPSRPKLKPIIPIRNWREDYARLIADLFAQTHPQSVGLCVMMWMNLQTAREFLDMDQLEPAFAQAMQDQEEALRGVDTGPFPPEVRKEIYRYLIGQIRRWDAQVPIYISTETREMWDEMESELGQSKTAFICGCGPMATPDGKLTLSPEMKFTTYAATDC